MYRGRFCPLLTQRGCSQAILTHQDNAQSRLPRATKSHRRNKHGARTAGSPCPKPPGPPTASVCHRVWSREPRDSLVRALDKHCPEQLRVMPIGTVQEYDIAHVQAVFGNGAG